jgi:hypothetical protein
VSNELAFLPEILLSRGDDLHGLEYMNSADLVLFMAGNRETPLRMRKGKVDVGPVWATEVRNARDIGLKVEAVEPGEDLDQRDNVNYYMAKLKNALTPRTPKNFSTL